MDAIEMPPEEVVGTAFGRDITTHTLIGLGLIACTLFVIWLVRRNA
ncbi:MAG TPA: hypothetical protein VH561_17210 [Micromonosporaceae bacterium]|jgi:hypothetical protein